MASSSRWDPPRSFWPWRTHRPGGSDVRGEGSKEGGTRMGALVTFTDLESRERISTQLQVSERMAHLAHTMKGVAHEVKNPLNSMRLWLENLKESLPAGDE